MAQQNTTLPPEAQTPPNPRFILELEFVCALANPLYLQHLGAQYPNLFISPTTNTASTTKPTSSEDNSDATCFARYLKYLLDYWRKPEYIHFLTHPAATIRNLELLQHEAFRRTITYPDTIARLGEGFPGVATIQQQQVPQENAGDQGGMVGNEIDLVVDEPRNEQVLVNGTTGT